MEKTYPISAFAAMAHTTPRALRLYDRKGLLKPSQVSDKGYRFYTHKDLLQLQKILMLKSLGFSLEEIGALLVEDGQDLKASLQMQHHLLSQRIIHMQAIKDSLKEALQRIEREDLGEERILDLLKLISVDEKLLEQYRTSKQLQIRINLHHKYGQAKQDWFSWLFDQMNFSGINRFLEVGAGNGQLWKDRRLNLRHREIFLSDVSEGMMQDAARLLDASQFSFMTFPIEKIPFRTAFFDGMAAHHVLFYLKDVQAGLAEIARVLKPGGKFYASAYGARHMEEVSLLVKEFDPSITLSSSPLYQVFGMENGREILEPFFEQIEFIPYEDSLYVTDASDLADYILSCHGNQQEKLMGRYDAFLEFLQKRMQEKGFIKITKEVGLFKAIRKQEDGFAGK